MEPVQPKVSSENSDNPHYVVLYGKWHVERHTPVNGQMVLAEEKRFLNIITTVGKQGLATLLAAAALTATTKHILQGCGAF